MLIAWIQKYILRVKSPTAYLAGYEYRYDMLREEKHMVSITCGSTDCKYNGRAHKCTAKSVRLTYRNMLTVNEGRVDMWVCDRCEMSDSAKRAIEFFKTHPEFNKGEW